MCVCIKQCLQLSLVVAVLMVEGSAVVERVNLTVGDM